MSLRYGLLGLLRHNENTGYELSKIFNGSLNYFWKTQMSQVYQELNKLEELGLLVSRSIVQDKNPNKRVYAITKAGINAFQTWMDVDDWDSGVVTRNIFLLRFFFAADRKVHDIIKILEEVKNRTRQRLDEMVCAKENCSGVHGPAGSRLHRLFGSLTADFGRRAVLARLEWVEETIKLLEGVENEGSGI